MQRKISGYFGRFRPLFPGSNDLLQIMSTSDEDAPMVSRICQQRAVARPVEQQLRQHARDGEVVNVASRDDDGDDAGKKRSRFEAEAEESSALDDDSDGDSDDSFVVPDHSSDPSSSSSECVPVGVQLRSVCAKLRDRRRCVQCAQCLRFMSAISVFLKAVHAASSIDDF